MSQSGKQKPDRNDSTSSGHGALGMGGDPSDDPRDLDSGHEDDVNDDRTRPLDGAAGKRQGDVSGGSVAGVKGDNAVTQPITRKTEP
ncbi:MAG: hypothetical protein U0835_17615 [Isosphaeraceae bacterium]